MFTYMCLCLHTCFHVFYTYMRPLTGNCPERLGIDVVACDGLKAKPELIDVSRIATDSISTQSHNCLFGKMQQQLT